MSSLSECWCFELFVELTLVCSQSRDAFDMDSWRTALGDGVNRSGARRLRAGLGSAGVIGSGWLRACFSFSAASLISAWSWRMSVHGDADVTAGLTIELTIELRASLTAAAPSGWLVGKLTGSLILGSTGSSSSIDSDCTN